MKNFYTFILAFWLAFYVPSSLALKLKGHVFVGQQVINDLEDDGKLTFSLNGRIIKITIDEQIKAAILNNKEEFLLGNIGPDIFPDVIVGQSVVHPGIDGAWQTNDWLEYLLSQANQSAQASAFTYGYLGHAATDVFAHTYVNQYAGDTFDLFDKETLVEQRHIILEGFIDELLPPFKDYQNRVLPDAHNLLTIDDAFAIYLRDTLIYAPEAQGQYLQSANAQHLTTIYEFREKINNLAESAAWDELHNLIVQYIALQWGVEISKEEAARLLDAASDVIDSAQSTTDEVQKALNDVYGVAAEFESAGFDKVTSVVNSMQSHEASLVSAKQNIENSVNELSSRLNGNACQLFGDFIDDPMGVLDPLGIADPVGLTGYVLGQDPSINVLRGLLGSSSPPTPTIRWSITGDSALFLRVSEDYGDIYDNAVRLQNIGDLNITISQEAYKANYLSQELQSLASNLQDGEIYTYSEWTNSNGSLSESNGNGFLCETLNGAVDSVQRQLLRAVQNLENNTLENQSQIRIDLTNLHHEITSIRDDLHDMENIIIDFGQVLSQDISPIQSYLRAWVTDIDVAMQEYVKATGKTMVNTIDPSIDSGSRLDPIKDWVACYNLSIVGIGGVSCAAMEKVSSIIKSISFIVDLANKAPLPQVIRDKVDDLNLNILQAKEKIKGEVEEELLKLIPEELQEIIHLNDFSASGLNSIYMRAENNANTKRLIHISDMANRVKAEMHIKNGVLDPDKFPVIKNSITLAKLALLDSAGLTHLEAEAGVAYGTLVFKTDNLVASAFKNLDGNHQWMEVSPPLPNSLGIPYRNESATYGTHINNSGTTSGGLLLWQETVRDKLFKALFVGPLSAGIDYPAAINKADIVPSSYPYRPCPANPYPNGVNDQTCTIAWLIPIISLLMN